jgi:hypothetical protein
METFLDHLSIFFMLCGFAVFAFGAYHEFMFKRGWWQQRSRGHGRWGYLNSNIPEPYRTHRWRSAQAAIVFLGLCALGAMTLYIKHSGVRF